jgi:hypothetical protein
MNISIEYVEVNDKKYKLQHPGNRAVLKLRGRCVNPANGAIDLEPMMDFCFEHVVIPEDHGFKPTIDNPHPKEFENWITILPRFLRRGDVDGHRLPGKDAGQG